MPVKRSVGVVSFNSLDYVRKIFNCYTQFEQVVLLRSVQDHERISVFQLEEIYSPSIEFGWFQWVGNFPVSDNVAHVAFTSGTEASPKGVELTHSNLNDVVQRLNACMEVDDGIREYIGVPANYSFGLGRFRAIAVAGGRAYLPENGFDPLEIRDLLRARKINSISAVPSLWRVLIKGRDIFADEVSEIRWIEIGSQYMSAQEKRQLVNIFPNAKIVQHYGLTEASRTTLLRLDLASDEQLQSVGKADANSEIKINPDGRIMIKGPHVATTYVVDGVRKNIKASDGWFQTNDLGHIKDEYLYYDGRADDLINCAGIKISPDAVEVNLRRRTNIIGGFGVVRIPDTTYGDAILLCYQRSWTAEVVSCFKAEVLSVFEELGVNNKNVIKFLSVDAIPVTDTGKVKRNILLEVYNLEAIAARNNIIQPHISHARTQSLTTNEKMVADYWSRILSVPSIVDIDCNFYDLGGDSMSALSAIIELERQSAPAGIAKGIMQGLSIREIALSLEVGASPRSTATAFDRPAVVTSLAINVVRGVLALCVVLAHWSEGFLERLPGNTIYVAKLLAPLLSIGTPGFSVIYGVSAGYALYRVYDHDPGRFADIKKKTLQMLLSGMLILAFFQLSEIFSKFGGVSLWDVFSSFYSVLAYYFLITLTLKYVFLIFKNSQNPIPILLLVASLSYSVDVWVVPFLAIDGLPAPIELLKLMLVGKYGYFNMLCGTCIGLTVGYHLYLHNNHQKTSLKYLFWYGAFLVTLGLITSYHANDFQGWLMWPVYRNTLWRWILYSGVVMVMLSYVHEFLSDGFSVRPFATQIILRFFATCGILAFPLFILHELVLPMKNILIPFVGFSNSVALTISLGAFLAIFGLAFSRVNKVSY